MGFFFCSLSQLTRCIVEQDVNPAHLLQGEIHSLPAVLAGLEVDGNQVALRSVLLDALLRVLRIYFLLGQVHNRTLGSLHGKQYGARGPDPTVASRDEHPLALELPGCFVGLLRAVGLGKLSKHGLWIRHVGIPAGEALLRDGNVPF
jgi:hypothetical protein